MSLPLPVTVVIPTYGREGVLLDTILALSQLHAPPGEILVLDQNAQHEPSTDQSLRQLSDTGVIRWVRLPHPSITVAMNAGLRLARHALVLFVDDDIVPLHGLVSAHLQAHSENSGTLVAGRVIQPWNTAEPESRVHFHFNQPERAWIREFMGGNFSIERFSALQAGGFDENFVRVAYRFEAEFAHRWIRHGGKILYVPEAALRHLKVASGGTRAYGDHLTTWRPDHAVGAYYYALRTANWRAFLSRPARAVITRHHLRRPWFMLPTLVAECCGMLWALALHLRGPRYATAGMGADL